MDFDTKIKILLRNDLEGWQELNVTAFLISGIAGTQNIIGGPYEDADGVKYLPMSKQPILIHSCSGEKLREVFRKVLARGDMAMTIFTEELFMTMNDEDNRAKVKECPTDKLNLVGIGVRGKKTPLDKLFKGTDLHR